MKTKDDNAKEQQKQEEEEGGGLGEMVNVQELEAWPTERLGPFEKAIEKVLANTDMIIMSLDGGLPSGEGNHELDYRQTLLAIARSFVEGATLFVCQDEEQEQAVLIRVRSARVCPDGEMPLVEVGWGTQTKANFTGHGDDYGRLIQFELEAARQSPAGNRGVVSIKSTLEEQEIMLKALRKNEKRVIQNEGDEGGGGGKKGNKSRGGKNKKKSPNPHPDPDQSPNFPPPSISSEHELATLRPSFLVPPKAPPNNYEKKAHRPKTKCAVCSSPAGFSCSVCKSMYYCCRDHQTQHWKEKHKLVCGKNRGAGAGKEAGAGARGGGSKGAQSKAKASSKSIDEPPDEAVLASLPSASIPFQAPEDGPLGSTPQLANISRHVGTTPARDLAKLDRNIHADKLFAVKVQVPIMPMGDGGAICIYDRERSFQRIYFAAEDREEYAKLSTTCKQEGTLGGLKIYLWAVREGVNIRIFLDPVIAPQEDW